MTYTVTQINNYIKGLFARDYVLNHIVVEGEISNFKESRGNIYFSLKDDTSSISCILFSNFYLDEYKTFADGLKVNVTGSIKVYDKNGTYSIYVSKIEKQGLGEYYIKLEALKKALLERGMFDDMYKKPIPKYSKRIGIVTAKNGAAIKDIEKTIRDKNPYVKMYLYPCKVQGDDAYMSIINGINTLDKLDLDCIIVGRGGGSIEDLDAFNNEKLAYTIFNASTPIISAVGHEINDSICDLVSDIRVATPTAAGEKATFSYDEFNDNILEYEDELKNVLIDKLDEIKNKYDDYEYKLNVSSPINKFENYKTKYILYNNNLKQAMIIKKNHIINKYENSLNILKSYNIFDKFEKGFSLIYDNGNKKINTINKVKKGDTLNILMKNGKIKTLVKDVKREEI